MGDAVPPPRGGGMVTSARFPAAAHRRLIRGPGMSIDRLAGCASSSLLRFPLRSELTVLLLVTRHAAPAPPIAPDRQRDALPYACDACMLAYGFLITSRGPDRSRSI